MRFRDFSKTMSTNDGTRTLIESILVPEIIEAINTWKTESNADCVLLGGLALSYYVKPRYTSDIDFLFLTPTDIPNYVDGFKRHRPSAFLHKATHVEVEVLTPSSVNKDPALVQAIFDTAKVTDGMKIASPAGLVAAKLGRLSFQDKADISSLCQYCDIDLTPFPLSERELAAFEEIRSQSPKPV